MTDDMFTDETLAQQEASDPDIVDAESSVPVAEKTKELAPPPRFDVAVFLKQTTDLLTFRQAVQTFVVKTTDWADWNNFGGQLEPGVRAAWDIIQKFGIRCVPSGMPVRHDHKDSDGDSFEVECAGTVEVGPFRAPCYGCASSRDPFFSMRHKERRSPYQINPAKVAKKAWSKCWQNGVINLFGLRMKENELRALLGSFPQDLLKLFGSPSARDEGGGMEKSGEPRPQPKDHTAADTPELRKKRDYIFNTVKHLAGSPELARAFLADLTTFTSAKGERVRGKENVGQLTAKQVERLYDRRDTDLSPARYADFLDRWNAAQQGQG